MFSFAYILAICFLNTKAISMNNAERAQTPLRRFPDDFFFGAGTASYQIEGAWTEGGKGFSIWDHFVHSNPDNIADKSTPDVSANSYHFYKKDVQILKELGVGVYRFSISWPRILPFGRASYVNPEGIAYYNNLIDELLANDITPLVTLYHWDLPLNLSELGGWLNEDIVQWFADYSRVLFEHFGDRVKHWITFNEPHIHCLLGFDILIHAPKINSPGDGYYTCGRNILLAHAESFYIYDQEFREAQGGTIGITLDSDMVFPSSNSTDDLQAADDYLECNIGHFAHPIFSETGNYPTRLIELVEQASKNQGLETSRLKPFSQEQIERIQGTADFMGVNHYQSYYVYRNSSVDGMYHVPSFKDDVHVGMYQDLSWPVGVGGSIRTYGPGFHKLLMYIKNKYNNPLIYITENGFSSGPGLNDTSRANYYREYLDNVLNAIDDGVNVKGYCVWSLMDCFEWNSGYTSRLGLYEIDMNDPERTRKPRYSSLVYREIVRSRVIDPTYDPPLTASAIGLKSSSYIIFLIAIVYLSI